MGYTTEFKGSFQLKKFDKKSKKFHLAPATPALVEAFEQLAKRHSQPGKWRAGSVVVMGRNYGQAPSLYCQWTLSRNLAAVEWDGGEKFYEWKEWLRVVLQVCAAHGFIFEGKVKYRGEDFEDAGIFEVARNEHTGMVQAFDLAVWENIRTQEWTH